MLPAHAERSILTASASIAAFAVASSWSSIPAEVRDGAARRMLNIVATGVGGARDSAITSMLAALRPFSGPPTSSILGLPETSDMLTASLLNAASANVLDFDDTHLTTFVHPSAPVFAPLLALGEHQGASGRAVLHAFILGSEVACRLGEALSIDHYRRGFHATSTCGVVGAAVACGVLLGLDTLQLEAAIGLAAHRSCGLVENLGHSAKSVGVGAAARDGLMAACYAKGGVDASARALEGPHGLFAAALGDPQSSLLTDGLGVAWRCNGTGIKPYPCAVVLNPVVDAALYVASRNRFTTGQVACIMVEGTALMLERADRPHVTTGREAKVSIQHATAVGLLRKHVGIETFSDQGVADPEVRALAAKVSVRDNPALAPGSARVEVRLQDGTTILSSVTQARGSLGRPLADDELERKALDLFRWGCPAIDASRLLDTLWRLEHADDIRPVIRMAAPPRT